VCVIAQLKSHEIGEYVDFANQLDQKAIESKLKGCALRFIDWLNQMVAPDLKKRFPDAQTALEALQPLYVKRTPFVEFDRSLLEFKATKLGKKLSQTVTIVNKTPETTLEGYWEVAPHPNDRPHTPDDHEWITISPRTIQGNEVKCTVTVDTSKLRAESTGKRELIFHSNAEKEITNLPIEVQTAPRPVKLPIKRYVLETLYSAYVLANMIGLGVIWIPNGVMDFALVLAFAFAMAVCGIGALAWIGILAVSGAWIWAWIWSGAGMAWAVVANPYQDLPQPDQRKARFGFWLRYFLAILCGFSLGLVFAGGFAAHFILPATALTSGAALLYCSVAPIFQHRRQLATYRRQEQHLIEP